MYSDLDVVIMSSLYAVVQLSPRTLSQDNLNMPGVDQDKAKDIFNLFDKVGLCLRSE